MFGINFAKKYLFPSIYFNQTIKISQMNISIKQIFVFVLATLFILPQSLIAFNPTDAKEIVFVISYEGLKNPKRVAAAKHKNSVIKKAVKKYWDAGMTCKFMIEKEAYKYARKNKGTLVGEFLINVTIKTGIGHGSSEGVFDIRDAKTKKILTVRLPAEMLDEADLAYALLHSQFMLRNLDKFKKPSKELPQKYGHLLKKKTLLVSEENMSKHFTKADLEKIYPHDVKVVSENELKEAILNKDDQHLVLYEASEGGNTTSGTYPFWNIYQPSDGVVVTRHAGNIKGLSADDFKVFIKRTSK